LTNLLRNSSRTFEWAKIVSGDSPSDWNPFQLGEKSTNGMRCPCVTSRPSLKEVESVHRLRLFRINLGKQIKGFGRIGLQFQGAIECEISFRVFPSSEIRLPEVVENLKRFRLQGVRLFQFELRRLVLFRGGQQHAECEVQLNVLLVRAREFTGCLQGLDGLACLNICTHQVESSFDGRRMNPLKALDRRDGRSFREKKQTQVVVCIAILWSYAQDFCELLFGEIKFLLSDI